MKNEFDDKLDWLAFCYVADELDETGREEFENRLAKDQSVRDAVERAVLLSQLVYAAQDETETRSSNVPASLEHQRAVVQKRAARFHANFLFAASITLALLAGGWFWYSNSQPDTEKLMVTNVESDSMVLAWAATLEQTANDEIFDHDQGEFLFDVLDDQSVSWMVDAFEDVDSENDDKSERIEQ